MPAAGNNVLFGVPAITPKPAVRHHTTPHNFYDTRVTRKTSQLLTTPKLTQLSREHVDVNPFTTAEPAAAPVYNPYAQPQQPAQQPFNSTYAPPVARPAGSPFNSLSVAPTPYPKPNDLYGRLVYFLPTRRDQLQKNPQYGGKPGEMQDVVRTFVAVLDGPPLNLTLKEKDASGLPRETPVTVPIPAEFNDMIWSSSPIVRVCDPALNAADPKTFGNPVVGRLRRFPTKGAKDAGLMFTPDDVERALAEYVQQLNAGNHGAPKVQYAWALEDISDADMQVCLAYHEARRQRMAQATFNAPPAQQQPAYVPQYGQAPIGYQPQQPAYAPAQQFQPQDPPF